jgi:hypothetical protein
MSFGSLGKGYGDGVVDDGVLSVCMRIMRGGSLRKGYGDGVVDDGFLRVGRRLREGR